MPFAVGALFLYCPKKDLKSGMVNCPAGFFPWVGVVQVLINWVLNAWGVAHWLEKAIAGVAITIIAITARIEIVTSFFISFNSPPAVIIVDMVN